ncbi:MAG: hypothetical protein DRO52_05985 [Candidatus Hecatellales archaeon]|nr:MAG: hypothetical protein DRO52_05985 [Candidatus Hecatellales archaeon]
MAENVLLVIPASVEEAGRKISSLLQVPATVIPVSKLDEEEIANTIAEACVGGWSAAFILAVTGPLLTRSLKKIFGAPFLSFDNAILSVVGSAPLARIIAMVSTSLEEETLLNYKALYEFTPNQIRVLKYEDAAGELPRLYDQGYRILLPCSARLVSETKLLEGILEKPGFTIENPLSHLREAFSLLGLVKGKPSTYKIKKVLPCIADPSKIRLVAQLDANIEDLLPILYLHLKRSNYIEALDALTFTTDRDEMVTIYGDGRVYAGKVEDPERLLSELLKLLAMAHDYLSRFGPPSKEILEARRGLNPNLIYSHLPKLNCGKCGESSCFAYAVKLLSGERKLEDCKPLLEEKYEANRRFLEDLLRPPFLKIFP